MTDMYGRGIENQGEYFHRYICGLYGILSKIRSTYPGVLFESCASGGNRYDLGMLYFMPQIWASDNTDAFDRLFIQEGTLYGYPQNSMGAHVSACPNHQTGNSTSIENRFNVAALGLLGYELDLSKLSEKEFSAVKEQVRLLIKLTELWFREEIIIASIVRLRAIMQAPSLFPKIKEKLSRSSRYSEK